MKEHIVVLLAVVLLSCSNNLKVSVSSPDEKINVQFELDKEGQAVYSVTFEDSVIIDVSRLGFETENSSFPLQNLEIAEVSNTTFNKTWKPVYGEREEIPDHYNHLRIHLKEKVSPEREFEISFKVFNEGVAFKYTFLPQPGIDSLVVQKELTEFNLKNNYTCLVSDRAQSEYRRVAVSEIKQPAERPLVVEAGENFLAIGEARLVDFARMKLQASGNQKLKAVLEGNPTVKPPYATPWRYIMVGKSAGELIENNYLLLNLNDPCALKDIGWIKPGKVIREVTLTTKGGMACVDFAAEHNLQFVEFDAGWYGPENDESSDATTVTVDPKRSPGPLDLHHVIEYASAKGIGIIVYVNRRALEKQLDEILPLYQSWGIKGVKYGFVNVGSQEWTIWLHEAIKKAAEHHLMVDVHDEYRPTGFSRTYPNLMTQEGIRGDEESPANEHTLTTLFTRMVAGAGDNTNCYFAPRVTEKMGGHVSQLAKAVMIYSPWQFLFWYDRPQGSPGKKGGAGSSEGFIQNVPELKFYEKLPTSWDETRILESSIGEFAVVARKSGNDWFLGALTASQPKELQLKTDFLDDNKNYIATICSYDPDISSPTNVKTEDREVTSASILNFKIQDNSGLAIHFH